MVIVADSIPITDIQTNVTREFTASLLTFYYLATKTESIQPTEIYLNSIINDGTQEMYIIILVVVFGSLLAIGCVCTWMTICKIHKSEKEAEDDRVKQAFANTQVCAYSSSDDRYNQASCIICLTEFQNANLLRKLVCSHIFHKNCIDQWIMNNINKKPVCPVCKNHLIKEDNTIVVDSQNRVMAPASAATSIDNRIQSNN